MFKAYCRLPLILIELYEIRFLPQNGLEKWFFVAWCGGFRFKTRFKFSKFYRIGGLVHFFSRATNVEFDFKVVVSISFEKVS